MSGSSVPADGPPFDSGILRAVQLVQLRLLKAFDAVCRAHDIRYWIDFGTLLGAVRHGGFIPWDDDLDVSMTHEAFLMFLQVAPRSLPADIFMQTMETDPLYDIYRVPCKLRDCNSTMIENPTDRFHQGIYIDIFPYHKVPGDTKKRKVQQRLYKVLIVGATQNIPRSRFKFDSRLLRKRLLSYIYRLVPRARVESWILGRYASDPHWKYRPTLASKHDDYCCDPSALFPLREISFEGFTTFAPQNTDQHLKTLYGEYTILPPVEQRRPLHIHHAAPNTPWVQRSLIQ